MRKKAKANPDRYSAFRASPASAIADEDMPVTRADLLAALDVFGQAARDEIAELRAEVATLRATAGAAPIVAARPSLAVRVLAWCRR